MTRPELIHGLTPAQLLEDVAVRLDGLCDMSQTDAAQELVLRSCIADIEAVLKGGTNETR